MSPSIRLALLPALVAMVWFPLPAGAAAPRAAGERVLVVGDSLAVGMRPYLSAKLPDRRLTYSVKSGITTPQGMQRLRRALRTVRPDTVVLSLGTNDGPDPRRFASRVARTLARLPADACVVWPTVHRPPRKGEYRGLNRVLLRARRGDGRLSVVDWYGLVARGSVVLPDGVHPDAGGYRRRARAVAAAVRRGCAAR